MISFYIENIQIKNKNQSYFFLHNRSEKQLYNFNKKKNSNIQNIKFEDYPLKDNENIFHQKCKFAELTINDECQIRLDRINK